MASPYHSKISVFIHRFTLLEVFLLSFGESSAGRIFGNRKLGIDIFFHLLYNVIRGQFALKCWEFLLGGTSCGLPSYYFKFYVIGI